MDKLEPPREHSEEDPELYREIIFYEPAILHLAGYGRLHRHSGQRTALPVALARLVRRGRPMIDRRAFLGTLAGGLKIVLRTTERRRSAQLSAGACRRASR